jgi:hypothetical protein
MSWLSRNELIASWVSAYADRCIPRYEPDEWTDTEHALYYNRCYNYACDIKAIFKRSAVPGATKGITLGSVYDCEGVKRAAIADGLVPLGQVPRAGNGSGGCGCGGGCGECHHIVALVIRAPSEDNPYSDYHWCRRDRGGIWSHKAGSGWPTILDSSNNVITDPSIANLSPYTFCEYFAVNKSKVVIG